MQMFDDAEKIQVAENCPGYTPIDSRFKSSTGGGHCGNCDNCRHWRNEKCQINLYDKVLTSLD